MTVSSVVLSALQRIAIQFDIPASVKLMLVIRTKLMAAILGHLYKYSIQIPYLLFTSCHIM